MNIKNIKTILIGVIGAIGAFLMLVMATLTATSKGLVTMKKDESKISHKTAE